MPNSIHKNPVLLTRFVQLACMLGVALLLGACSQESATPPGASASPSAFTKLGLVEGTHYKVIDKPVFELGEKFIVHEFFWYGCPHCQVFEPALHNWEKKLLGAVMIEQVPAIWADPMELHAKIFYLVQSLPREQREPLHAALFTRIIELRKQKDMAVQQRELAALLAEHGVDAEAFQAALQDEAIERKLERATRMMKRSGASSTPTLMINGRYLVLNDTAQQASDITAIADKIIRAERKRIQATK